MIAAAIFGEFSPGSDKRHFVGMAAIVIGYHLEEDECLQVISALCYGATTVHMPPFKSVVRTTLDRVGAL